MKIALINNLYEPVARGGAERIVELQAAMLRRAGHKVIIVTTKPWGSHLLKNDDGVFRVGGFAGSYFHLRKIPRPLRYLWHWLSWCDLLTPWYISLKLAITGCQLAIGHNLTGLSLWLPRFLAGCDIRCIQVLHDVQYLYPSGLMMKGQELSIKGWVARSYQLLIKHWLKPAQVVISPSRWLGDLFLDSKIINEEKIRILPNPIDISIGGEKKSNKPFKFFFIGQLEPHKGILELIKAFGELNDGSLLTIAGDGSLMPEVKKAQVANTNIKVLGRIDRQAILKFMDESSMLVIPSTCYENFPTVILEAFARKLPVMGSNWGGIKELLDHDLGILFDPTNNIEFVQALKSAVATTDEQIAAFTKRGYDRAHEFSNERYSQQFLAIVEKR